MANASNDATSKTINLIGAKSDRLIVNIATTKQLMKRLLMIIGHNASAIQSFAPTNKVIERRFLQRHLDKKCKSQEIDCEFSHAGCPAKMKRQEMKNHLEAKEDEHLKMVSAKCKDLESELSDLKLAFTKIASKLVFTPPPDILMKN